MLGRLTIIERAGDRGPGDRGGRWSMTEDSGLARLLARRLGAVWGGGGRPVETAGAGRRPGGGSGEGGGAGARPAARAERRLTLLRAPDGSARHGDVGLQAAAMTAARAAGVPVPEVYDHGEE